MRYLSVCSGIEAATVAWHQMDWEPIAFSEIEKFPSQVLAHHYPNVPNMGDMTKYKEWDIEHPDLLVGGTPCQSFSVAGLRKGLEDPRGNLALVYCGILDHYRPKWFVWENVPGVLSSNGGRDFGSFLGALAQLGYGFAYRVLDAQYWGVAQRRRRVFVVGHLGDWRPAAEVLFEPQSLSRDFAPERKKRQEITGTLGSRASSGGGFSTDFECAGGLQPVATRMISFSEYIDDGTASTVKARDSKAATDLVAQPMAHAFDARQSDVIQYGDMSGPLDTDGHTIGVAQPVSAFKYTMGAKAHGIGYAEEQSPTLDTRPESNAVLTNMLVRRLTPVECERLQGFPDNYTNIRENCPDGPRYKALGNSMAVPVMRWIGERIESLS